MVKLPFRVESFGSYRKEILKVWVPFLIVCIAVLIGTYFLFVEPPPPRHIVIATGQPTGSYYAFAAQYRDILARDGVELEIRETAGSADNVARLLDPSSGVSLAFVQTGTVPEGAAEQLVGLARLYREPLWLFYRGGGRVEQLGDLAGKRLTVGAEGSGTRLVALRLLADNGITVESQRAAGSPLLALRDDEAAQALADGRVDAAFFVVSPDSTHVQALMRTDGVRVMSFRRHESYVRRYPYLTSVTLSEGLMDLEANVPSEPRTVLAPTATLVANGSLHPALIPLILSAATAVHERGNLLDAPGEFPAAGFLEVPMSEQAKRFFKDGPPLLNRVLPFWPASLVDRLKFMLLPLLTVVISIFKIAQPIYQWRIRSRVYRHYAVLHRIDRELRRGLDAERANEIVDALRGLEAQLSSVSVPLWSMEDVYQLYLHIGHVRRRLEQLAPSEAPGAGAPESTGEPEPLAAVTAEGSSPPRM